MPETFDTGASGSSETARPAGPMESASGSSDQPYRPLSMLAMAGFGLAVAYTVLVLGGGIVSFFSKFPWLLSFWAILLPGAALAMSIIARRRIAESEGTLGGAPLARWGIGLSVVIGLSYGAYYVATAIAVRHQAAVFIESIYFDRLRKGEMEKSFVLTSPPPRPKEDAADLRTQVETISSNVSEDGKLSSGFSSFCQGDYVRMIAQGGVATRIEPFEVNDWTYEKGGYKVRIRYNVSTPHIEFPLQITVQSMEGGARDSGVRQWFVVVTESGLPKDVSPALTPQGEVLFEDAIKGFEFVQKWATKISDDDAYLDTLPDSELASQEIAANYARCLPAGPAGAGLAFLAAEPKGCRDYRSGLAAFRAGALISANSPQFWSLEKNKAPILDDVKSLFSRQLVSPMSLALFKSKVPMWEQKGDRTLFRYGMTLRSGLFSCEADVVASKRNLAGNDIGNRAWRIEGLELLRGFTVPESTAPKSSDGTRRPTPKSRK